VLLPDITYGEEGEGNRPSGMLSPPLTCSPEFQHAKFYNQKTVKENFKEMERKREDHI
jgi:hypothetical protein